MRGIEIAKKLNISTSALRHYESWGLVPEIKRAANGYRIYTEEHEAYFRCICGLKTGFGMDLVREVMPLIMAGKKMDTLWLLNEAQAKLHAEKLTIQRAVEMLDLKDLTAFPTYKTKKFFTIGEVAREANVSASAIRHWEKEGLITPERHKESGFRIYTPADVRTVLIIRTIQKVAYSLDAVREVLKEIDQNNLVQAKEIALTSLQYIDYALVEQVRGIAAVHHLFEFLASSQQ